MPVKPSRYATASRAKVVATLREQKAMKTARIGDVKALLTDLVAACPREQLGPTAAVAQDLIARVAAGEMTVLPSADAAGLLRLLVDVARLESGHPTSASMVAHVTDPIERVRELRAQARAALTVEAIVERAD